MLRHLLSKLPRFRIFRNEEGAGSPASRPPENGVETRVLPDAVLCNFDSGAADGWYPVAPLGDHPHPWGMQRLAKADAMAVVTWANGQGPDWTGVPIYASPAHPEDGDTPALAWAKGFRVEGTELQCLPEWSPEGQRRILTNREFKRCTPGWKCRRDPADQLWHPFEMDHIGMTNRPNIKATRTWVNAEGAAAEGGGAAPEPPSGERVPPSPPILRADTAEAAGSARGADPAGQDGEGVLDNAAAAVAASATASAGEAEAGTPSASDSAAVTGGPGGCIPPAAGGNPPPGLLATLANSLGTGAEPELITNAVDRLAESAQRLERELEQARADLAAERVFANAATVDRFIAQRRIDPAKRAAAIAICAGNRDEAMAVWGSDSLPAVVAERPPADPLAGVTLANASPAGHVPHPGAGDMTLIVNACRTLQQREGMTPEAANARAWELFRAGTIETVLSNSNKEA